MTHTLHRRGTIESLSKDIVFICIPAKGYNDEGSGPKLAEFMMLGLKNGCIKIGNASTGNEYTNGGVEKVIESTTSHATVHAVFNDLNNAVKMLKDLKEADLGMSIIISGLFDAMGECCKQAGLKRHTVEHSLGIWGRTDMLPSEGVLQINTMCGHGMVSVGHINYVIEKIKAGTMIPEKGAEELFKTCTCGIFNTKRAAELLKNIASET